MKLVVLLLGFSIINYACNQRILDKKIIDDSIKEPTDFLRIAYSIEEALKKRNSIGELSLSNVVDLDSIYLLENLYSLTIKNYSKKITALRIPESLFTLKRLDYLYIDGCKVILPQSISPDSRLETLHCWLSDTTSLSTNLENLSHLKHLLVKYKGTGPLPFRLEHLTQLESLELTLDDLTDLPASIGDLTNLESLKIMFYGNKGIVLPPSFTKLTKLKRLDLPVVEHLPENFHQLDQLNYLELELKEKSKEVVLTSVATLPALTTLKIRWINTRDFHFPIDLKRLEVLDLSHLYLNTFSCAMTHLKQLHLKNNSFKELPEAITKQANLEYLDLSYNRKLKELPAALSQLQKLQELELNGTPVSHLDAVLFRKMKRLERINLEDTEVSSIVKKKIQRQTPKQCSFKGQTFICYFN